VHQGPTVWVDDSHPIFRRGLVACLAAEGFRIAGESEGLTPAPAAAGLDLLLFQAEGTGLRRAVAATRGAGTRLVATVSDSAEAMVYDAVEAGAAAVLLRSELGPATLVTTLRAVTCGSASLPSAMLPRLLALAASGAGKGSGRLTEREREILRLLAEGDDTQEIAGRLCFSERTVKNLVHDLLVKMNCRNRAHAVAMATRHGVI
jgi:DNA-binding NarL/FixJ family response regulator